MRRHAVLIGAVLAAGLAAIPAAADMGMIHVSTQGVSVGESAQKAIILANGKQEVLILGTELQASRATPIVRFIPFPAEPKAALAPKGVFDRMAGLIAKYKLQYVTTEHSKGGPAKTETSGVEVHFAARLGSHDITVIRVRDAKDIRAWVNAAFKKKHLPTSPRYAAESIVQDYVARGIDWFVMDTVELSPQSRVVEPVAYSFASTSLYYPLKDTNSFGGKGEVDLFVLAPATLCAPGSNVFLMEGDKAVDAQGRQTGPCFGLEAKASTSAQLVAEEHDAAAIWPEEFFGSQPVFLQAIRYVGPFKFDNDVTIPLPQGVTKALSAPEPGENPWAAALAPEDHAQCKMLPDKGPCKGLFESFYFDQQAKSCKAFFWGGCQGTVPFKTQDECEKRCTPAH